VASDRYVAGLHDSGAGHLHPLRYTLGVGKAAVSAGARLHENSRVTRIEYGPTVRVHTGKGSVRAKFLALCANVDHVDLSSKLARRLIGVASYVVATEPLGARADALLKDNIAVADLNWIIDYYRLSADRRLLFGGRVSYSGVDPLGTARATRLRMLNVFPQLADVRVEYAWGGMIDITMSRAPDFGRLAPNVYYLQGYSGHGMVLTTVAGRIVAEAIAGQSERFDVFERLKHHAFPGGRLFRRPMLVMAMTWFRLRDLLP
jgi:gamma-glutamylputrescine oxidase